MRVCTSQKQLLLFVTTIAALSPMLPVAAERAGSDRCAELIKECFTYSGGERTTCFHASANHSWCSGHALGQLAHHRWIMAPVQLPGPDSDHSFLGPKVVDGECVERFDLAWSSVLVNEESMISLRQLTDMLNSCARPSSDRLMTP